MPRKKMTKADHVRAMLKEMGTDARPRDIVAALAAKGIKVGGSSITTLRNQMTQGGTMTAMAPDSELSVADMMVAAKFVQKVGPQRAVAAINLVVRIRGISGQTT